MVQKNSKTETNDGVLMVDFSPLPPGTKRTTFSFSHLFFIV